MQAEWELSKENFQPLKRGRKEVVCEQESKACQKADIEGQRRCVRMQLSTAARRCLTFRWCIGLFGRNLRLTVVKIRWTSGSGRCFLVFWSSYSGRTLHIVRVQVYQVDTEYLYKRWPSS